MLLTINQRIAAFLKQYRLIHSPFRVHSTTFISDAGPRARTPVNAVITIRVPCLAILWTVLLLPSLRSNTRVSRSTAVYTLSLRMRTFVRSAILRVELISGHDQSSETPVSHVAMDRIACVQRIALSVPGTESCQCHACVRSLRFESRYMVNILFCAGRASPAPGLRILKAVFSISKPGAGTWLPAARTASPPLQLLFHQAISTPQNSAISIFRNSPFATQFFRTSEREVVVFGALNSIIALACVHFP